MAIEIEKKYILPRARISELLGALEETGAVPDGEDFEVNVIYGGKVLNKNNAALRIRRTEGKTLLTLKKRLPNLSDAKQQLELETEVADADCLDGIFRELGMEPRVLYEKRRRKWRFRSVEVAVDELPFGTYAEIEGSLTSIIEAEMLLGIDDLEVEPRTYPAITRELGKSNGTVIECRFETDQ